jgi:hypothetical protein
VPDKRNVSKQRRAARNRASRDALAARRDNAVTAPVSSSTRTTKASPSGGSSSRGSTKGAARASARPARPVPVAAGPPPQGIKEMLQSKRPGDRAILLAFLLSFVSAILLLLVLKVTVDDRGDSIPSQYGALTIAARQAITGSENVTEKASTLSAYGPVALLMAATPVLIAGYALWANRRPDRSRLLTFALIAMAFASLLTGGLTIFLPTLIALGIGTFRIRKADMEAGMAAAPAPAAGGRGDVIDAAATDAPAATDAAAAPKSLLQRLLGPSPAAGGARGARASRGAADDDDVIDADVVDGDADDAPTDAATDDDPLAELEAELAAEADADPGESPDVSGGDDTTSGNGRTRRRR